MKIEELDSENQNDTRIVNPPPLVWLTLLFMLSFTTFIWYLTNKNVQEAARSSFQRSVEKAHEAVKLQMNAYEQVLRGGVGLFNSNTQVTRRTWHEYIGSLNVEEHFPGIQGIGFAQHIPAAGLQQHIRRIRAEGYPGYSVKPAGARAEYTAIIYLEPFNERNQRAFGYDMFSEPVRRAAMIAARDSGKATISGKVTLKQETSSGIQAGFLMYLPLYAQGLPLGTPAQRARALRGYVYSPFRMSDLMHGILGRNAEQMEIDLEIFDGTETRYENMMYDADGAITGVTPYPLRLFNDVRPIQVLGRTWTLAISSTRQFEAGIDYSKPIIVAFAGVAISLMFFVIGWSLSLNRARAQNMIERMRNVLTEQEGLISAIVEDAADGIITIDEGGHILSFNRHASVIFGYASEEVLGKNVSMLMPEPNRSAHDAYIGNYLRTGEQKIIGSGREVTGLRKNGETFAMDLAVSEVQRGLQHRMFAGIVRDISQRKKTENDLRLSEERFELAIRGAKDGLWDWDMVKGLSYHSPRWNAIFGHAEEASVVPSGSWLELVHPDDREMVQQKVREYLDGTLPEYVSEQRMRHRDGHYVWILSRGIAQRDAQGKPYRMVGIYSDISKQKQMDNLKSEFVSTVSHELRTPLTSIRGSLGLVVGGATGEVNAQARGMLEIAYKNTGRLLTLINDILDIEKIQSGKLEFHFRPQLLMPLLEHAIQANQAYAAQYRIVYELQDMLPDAMVNVDGDRMIQVMANLLSNAAKFSHEGGNVEIGVSRNGNQIRVAVTDHGAGIPQAFQERIFEKFSQADSSDTRHKGGTGLGLNISRAIVESMHGSIGFSSSRGAGTTFFVDLPEWRANTPA